MVLNYRCIINVFLLYDIFGCVKNGGEIGCEIDMDVTDYLFNLVAKRYEGEEES